MIDIYIHLLRKGKDYTTTLTMSVPLEHQEVILTLGKALCVHMSRAATITITTIPQQGFPC